MGAHALGLRLRGKKRLLQNLTIYHLLTDEQIFPTRLREYGVGLAAATQWLFNFVITEITPAAVNHIGWRTFIMFGCFCAGMCAFVILFIKETKGRTLEDMDVLFGLVSEDQRQADVEHVLNKGIELEHVEQEVHVAADKAV